MADTSIEWTAAEDGSPGKVWNPIRGCSPVSEGCRHCYAAGVAARFSGPDQPYEGLAKRVNGHPSWTGEVRLVPEALDLPLRWRKPKRIFVNSMSDLFHERLLDGDIAAIFGAMSLAPQHTFIVLTKRAKRMREWFRWIARGRDGGEPGTACNLIARFRCQPRSLAWSPLAGPVPWPLPNVILGVSVEDQATADERIPELLATPAACRAVSYEPALAEVSFVPWLYPRPCDGCDDAGYDPACPSCRPPLSWIVVGGESGPGARPCEVAWIRSTVRACRVAGVACFVKQLGARASDATNGLAGHDLEEPAEASGLISRRFRDRKGGDPSEWPENLRVREWPT